MAENRRVWVERKRLETVVHVCDWPNRSFGFTVYSSNEGFGAGGLGGGDWKDGDRKKVSERLGGGGAGRLSGAQKGRVLFAVGYFIAPSRWEPVGALLFSVPPRKSKPIVVFRVCVERALPTRDKFTVTGLLIGAAKKVATESGRGGGRLHWLVEPEDARQLCDLYGFTRKGNKRQQAVLQWAP